MGLAAYHIRLAWKSILRDVALSAAIVVGIAVAGGLCGVALTHYLHFYGPLPALSPALHGVELPRGHDYSWTPQRTFSAVHSASVRVRLSQPEYERIASTGVPTRQTPSARGDVLVGPHGSATRPQARAARFVSADFFDLFGRAFRFGQPWSRAQEAGGARVVVLSRMLNDALFNGEDSTGRPLLIEGRSFRVVGVLRDHPPHRPTWDLTIAGMVQDALALPYSQMQRLVVRPSMPIFLSGVGPSFGQLQRSDTLFVTFWAELPTPGHRARFEAAARAEFGDRVVVRSQGEWHREFPLAQSPISFFALVTLIVVLGAAFNAARLFLARSVSRTEENGVFRALGAPASSLAARQMWEAALLGFVSAAVAPILSRVLMAVFDAVVNPVDIPLRFTGLSLTLTWAVTLAAALLAGMYPAWRLSRVAPTLRMSA